VLDAEVVWRNKLLNARAKNRSDGRDDGPFRPSLIPEGDGHRALRWQVAFVNGVNHVLLDAGETEVYGSVGMQHRVVPLIGPGHRDGNGIAAFNLDVHVAAASSRMIGASGMKTCGLHRNSFVVRWSPVEDTVVLAECKRGAEQHRENTQGSHSTSICEGR